MVKDINMDIKENVYKILDDVKDPEIPVLSLVDLGVIREVTIEENNRVVIEMTPTFAGCPAINYMKDEILEALNKAGFEDAVVNISFKSSWNSNMISEKGKSALKKFGLAPPPSHNLIFDIDILENIPCPFCESNNTELNSPFGPTLCRSLHYCNDCKQAFEQFKPL